MPSACSVLPQWPAACPTDKIRVSLAALLLLVQLGSPGVTSGRCPIKLCAMSNVCSVALLKTLGLGGDFKMCRSALLHMAAVSKVGHVGGSRTE